MRYILLFLLVSCSSNTPVIKPTVKHFTAIVEPPATTIPELSQITSKAGNSSYICNVVNTGDNVTWVLYSSDEFIKLLNNINELTDAYKKLYVNDLYFREKINEHNKRVQDEIK